MVFAVGAAYVAGWNPPPSPLDPPPHTNLGANRAWTIFLASDEFFGAFGERVATWAPPNVFIPKMLQFVW